MGTEPGLQVLADCRRITLAFHRQRQFSDLRLRARPDPSGPGGFHVPSDCRLLWIATLTVAPAAAQQPFTLEHFRSSWAWAGWS